MGKVHGSLTRAGKVRGQTPKVEKQPRRRRRCGKVAMRYRVNRRNVLEKRFAGRGGRFKLNSQPLQQECRLFQKNQSDAIRTKIAAKRALRTHAD